jgi:hypothetical protein
MNQFLKNMDSNKIKIIKIMMNLTHKMKIKMVNKLTITIKKKIKWNKRNNKY